MIGVGLMTGVLKFSLKSIGPMRSTAYFDVPIVRSLERHMDAIIPSKSVFPHQDFLLRPFIYREEKPNPERVEAHRCVCELFMVGI